MVAQHAQGNEHPVHQQKSRDCSENQAGVLANVTSRLGEAGINLEAIYVTGVADGLIELAIISDNPKKAKKILEEF